MAERTDQNEGEEEGKKTRAPNWIADEIEPMISWLEIDGNYERTKNQGRDTWMPELASVVPTRTTTQVSYNYISEFETSLLISYRSIRLPTNTIV